MRRATLLRLVALVGAGCSDSGTNSQDGRFARQVTLHVHGLNAAQDVENVRAILGKQAGVSSVEVTPETGRVTFELAASAAASLGEVLRALKDGGYAGHAAGR